MMAIGACHRAAPTARRRGGGKDNPTEKPVVRRGSMLSNKPGAIIHTLSEGVAMSISEQLKEAIRQYQSERRLAIDAGVPQTVVNRLVNGSDARLSTVDKLAEVLGLELRPKRKGR